MRNYIKKVISGFIVTLIYVCESHVKSLTAGKACFSGKAIKSSLNKLSPYMLIYRTKTHKYQRNGMNTGIREKGNRI